MKKILIIEDEQFIRQSLLKLLERNQYQACAVESLEEAIALNSFNQFDLILSDIRLPGRVGTQVIALAKPTPVIIMTSFADVESAVNAMKLGAVDYVEKPFKYDALLSTIEKNINQYSKTTTDAPQQVSIIGHSAVIQTLFKQMAKIAKTLSTVIIYGESGTGKELFARSIHQQSEISQSAFIRFNCSQNNIDDLQAIINLQEQAFTLFLNNIEELNSHNQGKLLSLLTNDNKNKFRVIVATTKDLKQAIKTGDFRQDLYFRLSVFQLTAPPLRERKDDIALLAVHLLHQACTKMALPPYNLSKDTFNTIRKYTWPGNIRELANCLERAVLMCETQTITPNLLALDYAIESQNFNRNTTQNMTLEGYFRNFVLENQNHLTETELAKQLGISRKTLWERRQKFGIPRN